MGLVMTDAPYVYTKKKLQLSAGLADCRLSPLEIRLLSQATAGLAHA